MSKAVLVGTALLFFTASCGGQRDVPRNAVEPLPDGLSVAFSSKFVPPGAGTERSVKHLAISCDDKVKKGAAVQILTKHLETRGFDATPGGGSDLWLSDDGSLLVSVQSVAGYLSESAEPGAFDFYEQVRAEQDEPLCAVLVLSPN
jgi:hypothetical protein